ncbi:hypothetical protein KFE98_10400 [bacterium SCSIO 12741]|nr:hypothetical protein KFE98_10400 [bacterium SCSIO 12741]
MKKIEPFKSREEALEVLDNGGRFYNLWTQAHDGVITPAELGKASGIFQDKQQMMLFLDMSLAQLSVEDKEAILSSLDESLQQTYTKFAVHDLNAENSADEVELSSLAKINGVPQMVDSKSMFEGFMMFPIITGDVTTFSLIPMLDEYQVYNVELEGSYEVMVAHSKGTDTLPKGPITVGGILKEWFDGDQEGAGYFLEIIYYLDPKA